MKLQIAILVFGLIIISMGDVYGTDWRLYSYNDKQKSYYDAQSITHPSKNIVRVWVKWNYTEKGVINTMGMMGKFGKKFENLSHLINLEEVDCVEKKSRNLSFTYYNKEGNSIVSSDEPSEWNLIVPDSVDEDLYEEICK